jgi:site-specific recombinase XerD
MNTTTSTVILSASSDPLRLACAGFLARYAGKTLDSYRIHLELWLRWCTQVGVDPLAVRRPHVEIWLRSLEDQHLASATRAAKFGVVHLFYKYAVIDEIIDRDPTQNVTRPKIHEGEQKRTWLPTLDCVALLDAAVTAGPREHVFVVLLGQMALRVGEMCALNADSVHHNQGWRTVVFRGKGGDTFERVVPVQALRDLDRLIDGRTSAPLIPNTRGDRMDRAAADRLLHRLTRAAGITRAITPHGLRRSVATNMLAQGLPLRDVQLQLRHADPRMTMRYDQAKNSLDRAAVLPYASAQYGMLSAD